MIEKTTCKLLSKLQGNLKIADRIFFTVWNSVKWNMISEKSQSFESNFFGCNVALFLNTPKIGKFKSIRRVAITSREDFLFIKIAYHRYKRRYEIPQKTVIIRYSSEEFLHGLETMRLLKS